MISHFVLFFLLLIKQEEYFTNNMFNYIELFYDFYVITI